MTPEKDRSSEEWKKKKLAGYLASLEEVLTRLDMNVPLVPRNLDKYI